jgi:CHAT domain-containing protein
MKKLFCFLFIISISNFTGQQIEKIIGLDSTLREHIRHGNDELVISTSLAYLSVLDQDKSTDTLNYLILNAHLATRYNNLNLYEKTISIYENYRLCFSCKRISHQLFGSILSAAVTAYSNVKKYESALEVNREVIGIFSTSDDLFSRRYVLNSRIEGVRILMYMNRLKEAEQEADEIIEECEGNLKYFTEELVSAMLAKTEIFDAQSKLNASIETLLKINEIMKEQYIDPSTIFFRKRIRVVSELSKHFKDISDTKNQLTYALLAVDLLQKSTINDYTGALNYMELCKAYFEYGDTLAANNAFQKAIDWNREIYGENTPFNIFTFDVYSLLVSNSNFALSVNLAKQGLRLVENAQNYFIGSEDLYKTIANVYAHPRWEQRNLDSAMLYANKYQTHIQKNRYYTESDQLNALNLHAYISFKFDRIKEALPILLEQKSLIDRAYGRQNNLYRSVLHTLASTYKQLGNFIEYENYKLEIAKCWKMYLRDNFISIVGNIQTNQMLIDAIELSIMELLINKDKFKKEESFIVPYENYILLKNIYLNSFKGLEPSLVNSAEDMRKLDRYKALISSNDETNNGIEILKIEQELLGKSNEYKALNEGKNIDFLKIKDALKPGQLFIDFTRLYDPDFKDYVYVAFIMDKNSRMPIYQECGLEKEIRNMNVTKDMSGIYHKVWSRIEKFIPATTNEIIVCPTHELEKVPFAAICKAQSKPNLMLNDELMRGGKKDSIYVDYNCDYLIDRYTIRNVQSARSLLVEREIMPKKPRILGVGGVDFDGPIPLENKGVSTKVESSELDFELLNSLETLPDSLRITSFNELPKTEVEIDAICELTKKEKWSVVTLKQQEAKESNLKNTIHNGSFDIIHIATHGFSIPLTSKLQYGDPLSRCGLIFTGANYSWGKKENSQAMLNAYGDDGILTGNEVMKLSLSETELVVLSACQTSIGSAKGFESSQSLSRVFLMSGVDYVVSSLWSVPDKETMELMALFYSDLTKTLNPVLSFDKAQKEMRLKYPTEPEKWAGFVLVR